MTNDAISLNFSRSLWVNIPIKEGRHECGQGNFLDSLSLRMLDIVKCWNFSGAWVDFSFAWGLVSLRIHHVLPWLPKAGSLWDLEVQSTSLSHDSGINYIDLIRFFSGLKTNCITQTKWTWYSRWLHSTKYSNYIKVDHNIILYAFTPKTKLTPKYAEILSQPLCWNNQIFLRQILNFRYFA